MTAPRVSLASFENGWYRPGRGALTQAAWFFIGLPLLRSALIPFSGFRVRLLRWFGARVGQGVVIKPGVRVKYPWKLTLGPDCWLGEDCWIDNLENVEVGPDACISQGAYLCTGNHDWSDPAFGLIVKPIRLAAGAWIGARCFVAPGVTLGPLAIAAAGSVVFKDIPGGEIHAGNPAQFVRHRKLRAPGESGGAAETNSSRNMP